jgi:hypothetical protein
VAGVDTSIGRERIMSNRTVGADTAYPVTESLVAAATSVLGQAPAFWGRYFTSPQTVGDVEYRHRLEDAVLLAHGIRVLPIARQTNNVGGSLADGQRDGLANASDVLDTFGEAYLIEQGGKFLVFLDVEGSGQSRLSTNYYVGWADGLAQASKNVTFAPCVYGLPRDAVTWTALARAIANGVSCGGLWMSHPLLRDPEPVAWNAATVCPTPDPGAPVLLWQYMFARNGANIDRTIVNPSIDPQADLLAYLIAPPGPPLIA